MNNLEQKVNLHEQMIFSNNIYLKVDLLQMSNGEKNLVLACYNTYLT